MLLFVKNLLSLLSTRKSQSLDIGLRSKYFPYSKNTLATIKWF